MSAVIIFLFLLSSSVFLQLDAFIDGKIISKWYGFILFSLIGACFTLFHPNTPIAIDKSTTSLMLLLIYTALRGSISGMPTIDWTVYIAILALYLFFQISFQSFVIIEIFILTSCMVLAIHALLQYTMVLPTHNGFAVLGSYGNPAGLATNIAVVSPLIFQFSKQHRWLSITYISVMLLTVVLSGSRSGLIAFLFVLSIYSCLNLPDKFRSHKKQILFLFLFIGTILGVFLYLMKQNSAVGRTLIWQITGNLFRDSFLFGGGSYVFSRDYMPYQADYFVRNPESSYTLLADNIMYAFNEYLLLLSKYGLIAFIVLTYGFATLLRSQPLSSPYILCLISLGIVSLSSYPFQYPIAWLVLIYCLVQIGRKNKPLFLFNIGSNQLRMASLLFLFLGFVLLAKDVQFEYRWNKAAKASLSQKTEMRLPVYDELFDSWNGNHLFLYNYAAELNQANDWHKSLAILHRTVAYWNDYDIQLLYADNYMKLKQWENAEPHLDLASNMCPNRFLPLFKLHEIYVNTDRKEKAMEMASVIMEKEIKVASAIIYSIQAQMKRYIKSVVENPALKP